MRAVPDLSSGSSVYFPHCRSTRMEAWLSTNSGLCFCAIHPCTLRYVVYEPKSGCAGESWEPGHWVELQWPRREFYFWERREDRPSARKGGRGSDSSCGTNNAGWGLTNRERRNILVIFGHTINKRAPYTLCIYTSYIRASSEGVYERLSV